VRRLIVAVDALFDEWRRRFKADTELHMSPKPYMLDPQGLTIGAGIV
jgi:hypothetical protein